MNNELSQPAFSSSAPRAFQAIFESPNWLVNILWLAVAALTQGLLIGQIMLMGWGSDLLAFRAGRPGERVPDIDANRFGDYLAQGLWPFLVLFVVQCVLGAVMALPSIVLSIAGAMLGEDGFWLFLLFVPLLMVLAVVANLVSVPILIRGMLTQDFMASFDLNWIKDFVRRMFLELVIQGILFALIAMLVAFLGLLALCIGIFPASGIISGAGMHLFAQYYESYLQRGGMPVPSKIANDIVDAQVL